MDHGMSPIKERWPLILLGAAALALPSTALLALLASLKTASSTTPAGFVGLLVIFAVSLTLLALVFRWLGLSSSEEAFSLPPGSVRTLLAIGIMVLFVVFGLAFFKTSEDPASTRKISDKPIEEQVEAPAAPKELAAEIARYEHSGFAVTVTSRGSTGDQPENAKLKLYKVEHSQPAAVLDMQKQMVTAVVTLLTTVIGFYFGTRTAEGARDKRTDPQAPSGDAESQQIEADLKVIDDELANSMAEHEALRKALPMPGKEPEFTGALSALQSLADKLSTDAKALRSNLAAARLNGAPLTPTRKMVADLRVEMGAFKKQLASAALLAKRD